MEATQVNGFRVGDIVMLKSGSPDMTIESFTVSGHAQCCWYVNSEPYGFLRTGFPTDALRKKVV